MGFRPCIYRLAIDSGLVDWVRNSAQGVAIEVEGDPSQLAAFLQRIGTEKPPQSLIQRLDARCSEVIGYSRFEIQPSRGGEKTVAILPDLSTCANCLTEVLDPVNRRYRYPFTNCTHCGPRFSLIEALPYDRPHTTMRHFGLCDQCQAEYENPLDRRFHA